MSGINLGIWLNVFFDYQDGNAAARIVADIMGEDKYK